MSSFEIWRRVFWQAHRRSKAFWRDPVRDTPEWGDPRTGVDQGGCCETSRPTTHDNPVYEEEGIVHYCVANMPGAYARTATQALTNVTARFVEFLAEGGLSGAIKKQPAISGGVNVMDGKVRNRAVAQAHGLPYEPLEW
jgi:alanine dehydrogenase